MSTKSHIVCLFVVTLIACERIAENKKASLPENPRPAVGFPDYDWLPEPLKDTMEYLATSTDRHFNFYYFFAVDDINRHFYLSDQGLKVITEMPVTNEEALNLIEEKLYDTKTKERGLYVAMDTAYFSYLRQRKRKISADHFPYYERTIYYVLPEDTVDFSQLRVAIVEDTTVRSNKEYTPPNDSPYPVAAVDVPPRPMRGMQYFKDAITKQVQKAEVFILYDTGTVEVEFSVWNHAAQSPNLVRGFSTREDTHEAYQADGEFIKAVNNAKVRWHPAQKDGKPVASLMRVTFDISTLKNQSPSL